MVLLMAGGHSVLAPLGVCMDLGSILEELHARESVA